MEFHFNCLRHFSEQFSHNFICACMVHESNKINQLMVFRENTFLCLLITNACIPSSVKAHPQNQLCPLLVLCANHSNKDLSDPVFETKLLLFLLSMFVNALNFTKKVQFCIYIK